MDCSESVETIYIWDRFVRVFHWSLVSCVLLDYFVFDDGETLHQWLGYAACALVLARVVWGFVGSKYARFNDFFPTPTRIKHHLYLLIHREQDAYAGHNPLGALMMLALMSLVLALGVTGWMQGLDAYWGEKWLMDPHEDMASFLIGLAGIHAAAAIIMSHIERTNLIKSMITGVKVRVTTSQIHGALLNPRRYRG
jgi:cytochrome b